MGKRMLTARGEVRGRRRKEREGGEGKGAGDSEDGSEIIEKKSFGKSGKISETDTYKS